MKFVYYMKFVNMWCVCIFKKIKKIGNSQKEKFDEFFFKRFFSFYWEFRSRLPPAFR